MSTGRHDEPSPALVTFWQQAMVGADRNISKPAPQDGPGNPYRTRDTGELYPVLHSISEREWPAAAWFRDRYTGQGSDRSEVPPDKIIAEPGQPTHGAVGLPLSDTDAEAEADAAEGRAGFGWDATGQVPPGSEDPE